jgi:hypothetical protein
MKKIDKLNQSKVPIIVMDKELEKLRDIVLFPDKLKKAEKILKTVGLPKDLKVH